jgi:hypothetical protein
LNVQNLIKEQKEAEMKGDRKCLFKPQEKEQIDENDKYH